MIISKVSKALFCLAIALELTACGGAADLLYKELKKYGYIAYTTPLEHSGPGTLVGGSPRALAIVAHPQSCFPSVVDGLDTELRRSDTSQLPRTEMTLQVDAHANADLFKVLHAGSPSIGARAGMSRLNKVRLELKGIHVEYLDAIKLADFYRHRMSDICKDYLDRVGFIVQAIRVDQTRISFYESSTTVLKLTLDNIKHIVDFAPDVAWRIENNSILVIDTPKYLGYQLGRLRREDKGLALYRASQIDGDRYIFKSLQVFGKTFLAGERDKAEVVPQAAEGFFIPLEQVPPLAVAE